MFGHARLVNHARENLQSELVRTLYREEVFSDLLRENDDSALRRKQAMEMQVLLQKALSIVSEVRDFNAFSAPARLASAPAARPGAL